jgi:hypothetical protein
MLGKFHAELYEMEIEIDAHSIHCLMGKLPDLLEPLLPGGIDGILGLDVLK